MTLYIPPGNELQLTVKFMDWAMARWCSDNQIELSDATPEQVHELVALARQHDLVFVPAFNAPDKLDPLESKPPGAAERCKLI